MFYFNAWRVCGYKCMRPQAITAAVSQQPAQDIGVWDVLSARLCTVVMVCRLIVSLCSAGSFRYVYQICHNEPFGCCVARYYGD